MPPTAPGTRTAPPEPPDVAGYRLDGPGCTISADENATICASLGSAPAADGSAHPVWCYIATQTGMGLTVAGLCALCDFDPDDGPMLASTAMRFERPLMVGTHYAVTGRITSLTRKGSRKLGTMDLLAFTLNLDLPDGSRVCSIDNLWVLPRGRHEDA
jgi:hypothetical protein